MHVWVLVAHVYDRIRDRVGVPIESLGNLLLHWLIHLLTRCRKGLSQRAVAKED